MPRMRGARPSPRHRLAASYPHRIVSATPPQWLWNPKQISMWLNATYGLCVTAEEACNKACHQPEIFITDDTVYAWASANDVLNGAELTQVLDLMQCNGFQQDGVIYNDGPVSSVDWTNTAALQNAISVGPVKIGVAADQLQKAVPDPPSNGWFATSFQKDTNLDHCTSLLGFGSATWLGTQLGVNGLPNVPAYAMFTWGSVGVIDFPSMLAITGEAWLRQPSTVMGK